MKIKSDKKIKPSLMDCVKHSVEVRPFMQLVNFAIIPILIGAALTSDEQCACILGPAFFLFISMIGFIWQSHSTLKSEYNENQV